jgi:hypothetical protein
MFRKIWWRARAVRSDEGFEVNFVGLERGIEYREGTDLFGLEVERSPNGWIVYSKSLKQCFPTGEKKSVDDDTAKRIAARVRAALTFLKIDFVMDE